MVGIQVSLGSFSDVDTILFLLVFVHTNSSQVKIATYAGEGKVVLTTAVKLRIHGKTLKLSTIEEDLNNGSAFSFSIPLKWRNFTKTSTSTHDGHVSILLGGDNHRFFPTEVERDPVGMALYQSNITNNYMVYGAVPSNSITWSESPLTNTKNTVIINALTIQDIQDQLLLISSAEEFTNPSNREQLLKITKEKNIQAIMDNTVVDPVKNKVRVNCLYKSNLPSLGENYFGATKRILALHVRIADKPEIAAEMDKYINQQINNGNYIEINPEDFRGQYQLHFVAYNFVVSSTSSSTKVRMTTDSSMRTETGLSLNDVSQPAPGNVPNMRGILLRSRCHPHFAVYDIQKFFRSVLTSTKDSFLRIMCVPSNFFSSAPTPNPTWRYFRDQAIPFGDSASGDYATCAKVATVKTFITDSPPHLQPAILQAILEDTYIDDGGVGANSTNELSALQQEVENTSIVADLLLDKLTGSTFTRGTYCSSFT